jgi:hypothetical protein
MMRSKLSVNCGRISSFWYKRAVIKTDGRYRIISVDWRVDTASIHMKNISAISRKGKSLRRFVAQNIFKFLSTRNSIIIIAIYCQTFKNMDAWNTPHCNCSNNQMDHVVSIELSNKAAPRQRMKNEQTHCQDLPAVSFTVHC